MILTNKQEQGLKTTLTRYQHNDKYIVIGGYAGTGKSTLVKVIIESLDVDKSKVAYATYTGKAAEVLRKKGNQNAMTLHRLLYQSVHRPGGGFIHVPKKTLEYTIVVVDEVSMVPKSMIDLLMKHHIFIIFLGDPFQLPQIDKSEAHNLLDHPHVFLDEVMRQAAESEIIQLTMKIRNFEEIDFYKGNETIIIPQKELVTGHMLWADQIICGTNATRTSLNSQMRSLLGYTEAMPQDGEKMICLRNYWEDCSTDGKSALVNGMTGTIHNPFQSFRIAPRYVNMRDHKIKNITADFISEDGKIFEKVEMDEDMAVTGAYSLDWREVYALGKLKNKIGDICPKEFTYGYCITCHKSQGSEWNKVLVVEEKFPFDKKEHARWLYTACTRSAQRLVLIRP